MVPKVIIRQANIQAPRGVDGLAILARMIAKAEIAKRSTEKGYKPSKALEQAN